MRVTLDTNVLVSALLFGGNPDVIIKLAVDKRLTLVVSPFILDEFTHKLMTKFGFSAPDAQEARFDIETISEVVHPQTKVQIIRRKDSDNRILECAVEGRADVLVTGDLRDLRHLGQFQEVEILTPREFLDKYFPTL